MKTFEQICEENIELTNRQELSQNVLELRESILKAQEKLLKKID